MTETHSTMGTETSMVIGLRAKNGPDIRRIFAESYQMVQSIETYTRGAYRKRGKKRKRLTKKMGGGGGERGSSRRKRRGSC